MSPRRNMSVKRLGSTCRHSGKSNTRRRLRRRPCEESSTCCTLNGLKCAFRVAPNEVPTRWFFGGLWWCASLCCACACLGQRLPHPTCVSQMGMVTVFHVVVCYRKPSMQARFPEREPTLFPTTCQCIRPMGPCGCMVGGSIVTKTGSMDVWVGERRVPVAEMNLCRCSLLFLLIEEVWLTLVSCCSLVEIFTPGTCGGVAEGTVWPKMITEMRSEDLIVFE